MGETINTPDELMLFPETVNVADDNRSLEELESVIQQGLQTFMEVGAALLAIREKRRYKEKGYSTFEGYCQDVWGWGRRYVNRTIKASEAVAEMGPIGPKPASESQARPLTKIEDPKERSEVWTEAYEEAQSEGKPVTSERVSSKVNQHLEQSSGERDLGPRESQTTEEVEDVGDTEEQTAHTVPRIVRAATMEYVVDFYDGYPPRTTHRNVLLEEDYKKCECCKGHGIVERHQQ